jgi:hypothetical protein
MQLEPNLDNQGTDGEAPLPEQSPTSNRTFILLAIPLVIVFLCIAGGLGYYALVVAPQTRHAKETQVANVVAQNNTQIAIQTSAAQKPPTPTVAPTLPPPTNTPVPPPSNTAPAVKTAQAGSVASPTPLLAITASVTPVASATNTTVKTPASGGVSSPTPITSPSKTGPTPTPGKSATPLVGGLKTATPTQLPGTGFADEAGVPMLIVVALGLVAVAAVVRRLRFSLR